MNEGSQGENKYRTEMGMRFDLPVVDYDSVRVAGFLWTSGNEFLNEPKGAVIRYKTELTLKACFFKYATQRRRSFRENGHRNKKDRPG